MTLHQSHFTAPLSAWNGEFLTLISQAFDGIAVWEPDPWRVVYANSAFQQMVGEPCDQANHPQLVGMLDRFIHDDAASGALSISLDAIGNGTSIDVRLCRIARGKTPLVGMIVHQSCESAPKHGQLNDLRHDPLTGLPDREYLMSRLAALLKGERSADRQFAVLFLDLDNFKQVNDEFGHLVGNDVLREAARRIADCMRGSDRVARFGGDEFVAIVEGVTASHDVEALVSRIQMSLAASIALPEGEISLSLSAGFALASESTRSPEELLAAADRAMYAAKRAAGQSAR
jgi:diguanylate cyclase (GGDEF)-like protein